MTNKKIGQAEFTVIKKKAINTKKMKHSERHVHILSCVHGDRSSAESVVMWQMEKRNEKATTLKEEQRLLNSSWTRVQVIWQ